jgi:hypothetical protein
LLSKYSGKIDGLKKQMGVLYITLKFLLSLVFCDYKYQFLTGEKKSLENIENIIITSAKVYQNDWPKK